MTRLNREQRAIVWGIAGVIVVGIGVALFSRGTEQQRTPVAATAAPNAPLLYIANPGGFTQVPYASTEAMDALKAKGANVFRVDLSFTSDQQLVCMPNWNNAPKRTFRTPPGKSMTLAAFNAADTLNPIRPCTLASLAEWLKKNPDATVVVQVPKGLGKALPLIKSAIPDAGKRVIIMIDRPRQHNAARKNGFGDIIWNVERSGKINDADFIANAANKIKPHALLFSVKSTQRAQLMRRLNKAGHVIYAAGVNTCEQLATMKNRGVRGIISGKLMAGSCAAPVATPTPAPATTKP